MFEVDVSNLSLSLNQETDMKELGWNEMKGFKFRR